MQVGSQDQPAREVTWYLAKVIPDVERNEPRNVGLIVRVAELEQLVYRFLDRPFSGCGLADLQVYRKQLAWWTSTMDKHGPRCLYWILKPKDGGSASPGTRYYIELTGTAIRPGRVNFDALFKRLVEVT